jgi:hypothetical protein
MERVRLCGPIGFAASLVFHTAPIRPPPGRMRAPTKTVI